MTRIEDDELSSVLPQSLFLRDETSDGLVGWGEQVMEDRARTVRSVVEELLDNYLLGEDTAPIENHWQTTSRGGLYRDGPVLVSAIAGVDHDWNTPVWRHGDGSVAGW